MPDPLKDSPPPTEKELSEAISVVARGVEARSDELYEFLLNSTGRVLRANGIERADHHPRDIHMCASGCASDWLKLAVYYNNSVEFVKRTGYLCFWVRKVKPYYDARNAAGDHIDRINERLSFWMARELIGFSLKQRGESKETCEAVAEKFDEFLQSKRFEYYVESASGRTFGPHHYVIWLKELLSGIEFESPFGI